MTNKLMVLIQFKHQISSRFSLKTVLFFTLALVSSNTPLYAADLTLDRALSISRNYWLQKSEGGRVSAELNYQLAKTNFLPSLTSEYTAGKQFIPSTSQNIDQYGRIILRQTLLDVSSWKTLKARDADVVAGNCDTEIILIDIGSQIIDKYFSVLMAIDEDKVQKKRQSRIKAMVDLLEETTKLRITERGDHLAAESELLSASSLILQNNTAKENSMSALRTALGWTPSTQLNLDEKFLETTGPVITDWQKWTEFLPDVLGLKAKSLSAEYDLQAANLQIVPALSISANYNNNLNSGISPQNTLSGLLSLNFPIFDQGTRAARAAFAASSQTIYSSQIGAKKIGESNTIYSLIAQRKSAQETLVQVNKQKEYAEQAYEATMELLSLGKKDYASVRIVQDDLLNAERQYYKSKRLIDQTNASLQFYYDTSERLRKTVPDHLHCSVAASD